MYKITLWTCVLFVLCVPFSPLYAEDLIFSYDSLKELVLNKHPSMRAAQYDIDIAQDQKKLADYIMYPKLNLNLGGFPYAPYLYMSRESIQADWTQWGPAFVAGLNTYIPIYDFGRSENYKKAAFFNKEAQEDQMEITRQDIILQVKNIYWNYLSYNSFKKYIFDTVSPEFANVVSKNEKEFMKGTISRDSLEQSRIDNINIKKEFANLERQKKTLEGQLNLLLNRDSTDSPLNIEFKAKYIYQLPITLKPYTYYLSIARNNNPYLKKMFNGNMAAQYFVAAQKAGIWPNLGFYLNASYTFLNFNRKPDYYNDIYPDAGLKFAFGFALTWSLNVWDHLANYDLQNKNYLKQLEFSKQADQQLENTLQQAYYDLEDSQTQMDYQKEMLTIAQRNFIFTRKAKDTGAATAWEVSRALRKLFEELKLYYFQIRSFDLSVANFERYLAQEISNYQEAEEKEMQSEVLLEDKEES